LTAYSDSRFLFVPLPARSLSDNKQEAGTTEDRLQFVSSLLTSDLAMPDALPMASRGQLRRRNSQGHGVSFARLLPQRIFAEPMSGAAASASLRVTRMRKLLKAVHLDGPGPVSRRANCFMRLISDRVARLIVGLNRNIARDGDHLTNMRDELTNFSLHPVLLMIRCSHNKVVSLVLQASLNRLILIGQIRGTRLGRSSSSCANHQRQYQDQ
jgi:hypothetical protein